MRVKRHFLPTQLSQTLDRYLEKGNSQETLNELFHLLKKYDLSTQEEQDSRNEKVETDHVVNEKERECKYDSRSFIFL
ncbi:hypothetical protein RCO48_02725 [Peribacillus frigoritolerans]|nr:hypothetical protein [Peribacillus frigoritolerans]